MMAMDEDETIENLLGFEDIENNTEEEEEVDEVTEANTAANAANGNQPGEAPPKRRINRKSIPKLDSNVLLSENGLRKLQTLLSKTSFKRGKGHERENLNRLINVYQLWGHNLYPRLKFKSIVEKTEKLCTEKRLKIAYMTWKEANKYKQKYEDDDYNASGIIRDDHPNEEGFNMDIDIFKPFSVPTGPTASSSTTNVTTTVPNETINHLMLNSDQPSTSTPNIPLSRLSHPLTEEDRAFMRANRERALQKLRQKKEEQRKLRELKEKQEQEQQQQLILDQQQQSLNLNQQPLDQQQKPFDQQQQQPLDLQQQQPLDHQQQQPLDQQQQQPLDQQQQQPLDQQQQQPLDQQQQQPLDQQQQQPLDQQQQQPLDQQQQQSLDQQQQQPLDKQQLLQEQLPPPQQQEQMPSQQSQQPEQQQEQLLPQP